MAYNEALADKIRQDLNKRGTPFYEKKMFGGVCFMVDDKMCAGVLNDQLMARIDPDIYRDSLWKTGASEMNFTGSPMKGYVFVNPEGWDSDSEFSWWMDRMLEFNPRAKAGKKKTK